MFRRYFPLWTLLIGVLAVVGVSLALQRGSETAQDVRATMSVAEAVGGASTEGFARAAQPRVFVFPQDHAAHPYYRIEWWYVTGNLDTPAGRHFGYQLTFFRSALSPDAPERDSAWATNQVYLAHFAVTDVDSERFVAFDRLSRGAVGLAGAEASPFRVWVESWSVTGAANATLPMTLTAAEGDVSINLTLDSAKPIVLNGEKGLSQKGPDPNNASYYYSMTRMPTAGTITVGDATYAVSGLSWMDREWSTSVLEPNQVGWDWFALQLDDGRDLMIARLRDKDENAPYAFGTWVEADGASVSLTRDEIELEPLQRWESPTDGASYPIRWRVRVPSRGIDLTTEAWLPNQELNVGFRYWEGAVRVEGSVGGRDVSGNGYVEMTGYGREAGRSS
ncbi:MAG: carotenoid 1,2-hydratase [Candidatus Poribacteria bacterium]|nr:carotenoid 1,2-hydratase [Candidatus Poribacteria bacterium]